MRHGIVVCAFVLAAGLLLNGDLKAGSLEPPGPPAPTMKTLQQVESRTPITSLPFTISAAGSYYLTGNLTGVSGQAGITITSSYVTLDLNGFALIGGAGTTTGIIANAGTEHLVIRNGVVRAWGGSGIVAHLASEIHAEDLRVDGNGQVGIIVGARSIVRNVTSTGNAGIGIQTLEGSTVTGCTAGGNSGQAGIVLGFRGVLSNSTASNNLGIGIRVDVAGTATDCVASQNNTGIVVQSGSRVFRSVASQNVVGISGIGSGSAIVECTAESNTDDGILVGTRGLVRGNIADGNTNEGIQATGSHNRIEDNQSYANGGAGIRVDGGNNVIVKNTVGLNLTEYSIIAGNQLGPISTSPGTAGPWANFDQ